MDHNKIENFYEWMVALLLAILIGFSPAYIYLLQNQNIHRIWTFEK